VKPEELAGEFLLPFRSLSCALAMLAFAMLLTLVGLAGLFGIWLAAAVVPALFRYLVLVAESRAMGRDVDPPGIEYFTLGGSWWALFPVLPSLGCVLLINAGAALSPVAGWLTGLAAAAVLPAMIAVLVITHSPVQSLNPLALVRLVGAVGWAYLLAPALAILLAWLGLGLDGLPAWLVRIGELYVAVVLYAHVGALIRERGLLNEVDIPHAPGPEASARNARTKAERALAQNHAYALASRGNRRGAIEHLRREIGQDPEPERAASWHFEQMLSWEDPVPALLFAQRRLGDLLARGEEVGAVKLMLRCRLVDEAFRPLPGDLAGAIEAAQRRANGELAAALAGEPPMAGQRL
jgi:hypothetical protein